MAKSTKKFKTEVNELLNLVIRSLYSNRDIFLRELVSNSSDAIDKIRFASLSDSKILGDDTEFKITIEADKEKSILRIIDNGVGMNKEEIEANIGTIARSGTKAFVNKLKESKEEFNSDLIGQFGVGFYSSFMVADKVVVTSKSANDEAVRWHSQGTGQYTIEDASKDTRGTTIELYLKEDAHEFLEEWKIRQLVKKYSDYLSYPVCMDVEKKEYPRDEEGKIIEGQDPAISYEEEVLNSQKALWTRDKKDIKEEEYDEFYQHLSRDFNKPLKTIHFSIEGTLEFQALLFIPEKAPYDLFMSQEHKGVHLYVKRVFIMDDCKALLPEYLRFIKGVVDSNDLPLNVSRELLQEDQLLAKIKKNVVKKILDALKQLKNKAYESYVTFYQQFGKVLKEGMHTDFDNKDRLQELLLFESTYTKEGEYTSLADYVSRMKDDQKDIYYISADNRKAVENSPYLEVFKEKGYEVLFFIDPIDEWVAQSLTSYQEKNIKSVAKGDVNFDSDDTKENEDKKDEENPSLDSLQEILKDHVESIRFSKRLTSSACCLVAQENAMGANMERIFSAMNQEVPNQKRILELNEQNPLIQKVLTLSSDKSNADKLSDYAFLLYDQALLNEGSQVLDSSKFTKRLSELMLSEINAAK